MMGTGMEPRKVSIVVAIIATVGAIVVAFIEIFPLYFPPGNGVEEQKDEIVSPTRVVKDLADAGIYLSDTDEGVVLDDLKDDPAYQQLVKDCLAVLKGKRVKTPIPLDVINGMYKVEMGGTTVGYLAPGRYGDLKKVKEAIFRAWEKKQPGGFWEKGFGDVVVGR